MESIDYQAKQTAYSHGANNRIQKVRLNAFAVAFGLALVVIGILLTEAGLRWLIPPNPWFYVHPPGKVARFRPLPEYMPGIHGISTFTVNSQGIRGGEFSNIGKEFRILAIGGSTTKCFYLDDTEAWPYLVQKMLPQTLDESNVWVGNVGKDGANSRDHVLQVKYLLHQYPKIDVVLVLVGVNDLSVDLAQGDNYAPKPPLTLPEAESQQLRRTFSRVPGRLHESATQTLVPGTSWYKKTAVYQAFLRTRSALNWRLMSWGVRQYDVGLTHKRLRARRQAATHFIDHLPDLTSPLAEYARNLNRIVDLVKKNGSQIVLMTQPVLWRRDLGPAAQNLLWFGGTGNFLKERGNPYYSVAVLEQAMNRYNETLIKVCKSRGINYIDLAKKVPRTTENFYDDVHFTEKGARLVAKIVSEYFLKQQPFLVDSSY